MTPTATRTRRLRIRDWPETIGNWLLAALALVTLVVAWASDATPAVVHRIEIVNPTLFQVEIDVRPATTGGALGDGSSGGSSGGWLALGGVRRESSRTVEEILDQGDRWLFRFSYGGVYAGEVQLSRSQLRTVTVPGSVGDRLAEAGFTPSAF